VWGVIGAISAATSLRVTTGVTCPTVRVHPAIVAQAAATAQSLLEGRFVLGVGSGEALNEQILGDRWPPVATRLEMLDEAVQVMRELWKGGLVTHHGKYYTVENARLYSLPDSPPPVAVTAFGEDAADLAARIGEGFVTVQPDAALLGRYRSHGGSGPAIGALKVCWDKDEGTARKTATQLWPTEVLEGQLAQELALPSLFESASAHVTEEMVADAVPCGPDPERHVEAIAKYLDAGFDEVYINQIGPEQEGFFSFYSDEIEPRLGL
jgi:G6PDH family F420-dependent oxidoreductase